jgi:hypothetical protein
MVNGDWVKATEQEADPCQHPALKSDTYLSGFSPKNAKEFTWSAWVSETKNPPILLTFFSKKALFSALE